MVTTNQHPQTGDYSVYWIHWTDNTDPWTEGYIGISKNPEKRLKAHRRRKDNWKLSKCLNSGGVMSVLWSGLDEETALGLEVDLRPIPDMALNIAEGGGKPPVEQLREAQKKSWSENHEMRVDALRNVGEETRRKRSENAKKQHAAGKLGNKGSKHRRVDCVDCGKSVSIACLWRHVC